MSITVMSSLPGVESGESQPTVTATSRERGTAGQFVLLLDGRAVGAVRETDARRRDSGEDAEPQQIELERRRSEQDDDAHASRRSVTLSERIVVVTAPAQMQTTASGGDESSDETAQTQEFGAVDATTPATVAQTDGAVGIAAEPVPVRDALTALSEANGAAASSAARTLVIETSAQPVVASDMTGQPISGNDGPPDAAATQASVLVGRIPLDTVQKLAALWNVNGRQIAGEVLRGPILEAPPIFAVPPTVSEAIRAVVANADSTPVSPTAAADPLPADPGRAITDASHQPDALANLRGSGNTVAQQATSPTTVAPANVAMQPHSGLSHEQARSDAPDVQAVDAESSAVSAQSQVEHRPTDETRDDGSSHDAARHDTHAQADGAPANLRGDGVTFAMPGRSDVVTTAAPATSGDTTSPPTALVDRVIERIREQALTGPMTIRLRLDADEHGQIDVRLVHRNGAIQVHLIAADPQARDALERGIDHLRRGLTDGGFQVQRVEVSAPTATADAAASGRNDMMGFQQQSSSQWSFSGQSFPQVISRPDLVTHNDIPAEQPINTQPGGDVSERGIDYRA
jgi:flagellar hook-length control protein FliK